MSPSTTPEPHGNGNLAQRPYRHKLQKNNFVWGFVAGFLAYHYIFAGTLLASEQQHRHRNGGRGGVLLAVNSPPTTNEGHQKLTIDQNGSGNINTQVRIKHFNDTALSFKPVTDKIGYSKRDRHCYYNMYGQFLLELAAHIPALKFLEIGLGCNMNYGPGASVNLWKTLLTPSQG